MTRATLTTLIESHLWPHQVRAVDLVRRYLKAHKTSKATGSALIRFPTGTGKTAVIAVAARILARPGIVVVVCPSEALREQLRGEIDEEFWAKLGVEPPGRTIEVEMFLPSNISSLLKTHADASRLVLVGTAQSLAEIHRRHQKSYKALAKQASLLVFDEGHREPARTWGEAARGLGAPSVLFSATPYRNDYALFDIEKNFVETLSFHDALKDRCIRSVDVQPASLGSPKAVAKVVTGVLEDQPDDTRAIVRCATRDSIIQVVKALRAAGLSAIGIHDK